MQIVIDKEAVKASFSKAAHQYDAFADLQREIGNHLISLINFNKTYSNVLDLGCGTGYFSRLLTDLTELSSLTCFDLSPNMLEQANDKLNSRKHVNSYQLIQGDIDHLPFIRQQFDLIFSSLVLQWSEDLRCCLKQIKKALNEQGKLCFSTLLSGSLFELEQAWANVDNEKHINQFLTQQQVFDALKMAGFSQVELTTETRIKRFPSLLTVMKALKGIGANHVHGSKQNSLTGKQLLKKLDQGYQTFVDNNGLYCLSYQVCYVVAQ